LQFGCNEFQQEIRAHEELRLFVVRKGNRLLAYKKLATKVASFLYTSKPGNRSLKGTACSLCQESYDRNYK